MQQLLCGWKVLQIWQFANCVFRKMNKVNKTMHSQHNTFLRHLALLSFPFPFPKNVCAHKQACKHSFPSCPPLSSLPENLCMNKQACKRVNVKRVNMWTFAHLPSLPLSPLLFQKTFARISKHVNARPPFSPPPFPSSSKRMHAYLSIWMFAHLPSLPLSPSSSRKRMHAYLNMWTFVLRLATVFFRLVQVGIRKMSFCTGTSFLNTIAHPTSTAGHYYMG